MVLPTQGGRTAALLGSAVVMPMVWTYSYALCPTALLRSELQPLALEGRLPRLARPQLWRSRSVGGRVDAGQHRGALTHLKLVFLADLHRLASTEGDDEDARAARILAARLPLDEAFFDARWTIVNLGPIQADVDATLDRLHPDDLHAVQGPDGLLRSPFASVEDLSMRAWWHDKAQAHGGHLRRVVDFTYTVVTRLCERFDQRHVELSVPALHALDLTPRLAADGITVARPSRLHVALRLGLHPGLPQGERRVDFKLYRNAGRRRGGVETHGRIFGEGIDENNRWVLRLETIQRTWL